MARRGRRFGYNSKVAKAARAKQESKNLWMKKFGETTRIVSSSLQNFSEPESLVGCHTFCNFPERSNEVKPGNKLRPCFISAVFTNSANPSNVVGFELMPLRRKDGGGCTKLEISGAALSGVSDEIKERILMTQVTAVVPVADEFGFFNKELFFTPPVDEDSRETVYLTHLEAEDNDVQTRGPMADKGTGFIPVNWSRVGLDCS